MCWRFWYLSFLSALSGCLWPNIPIFYCLLRGTVDLDLSRTGYLQILVIGNAGGDA